MIPVRRKKQRFKTTTVSLKQSQIITELEKKYFGEDNNFIDYFMEVGIDPDTFKDSSLYEVESADELSKKLTPKIITKFPNFDKRNIVVETGMIQQIFPQGFKAIESETKPKSQFYCVVLDNQLYSAIYTNKYLACLIVYENISCYKTLFNKHKYVNEKGECLVRNNSYSGRKTMGDLSEGQNFYIPKCLSIVSVHPCVIQFEKILREIYCMTMSNEFPCLFLENIIEKLIIETPKIPKGYKNVILKFPHSEIDLIQNKMNEYPAINNNISKIFTDLSLNNILEIYKYLLYETKMVFFSVDLYTLTNAILCFVFLLSPFKYQFQIVSVLPSNLYKFMETISPFIFGINEKYNQNFLNMNDIIVEDTICFVDIDNDNYYIVAPGGRINPRDYPEIPKNLKDKLEIRINKYHQELKKSLSNSSKKGEKLERILSKTESLRRTKKFDEDNVCHEFDEEKNKQYQLIFYEFMIDLLKDYPQYLSKDYSVTKDISMSTKDMIDLKSYVNIYSNSDKDFYSKIFNTQMFIEFIYKRMMPKDCNEKVEILFFEEKINEKIANKKLFSKSKMMAQNILLPCKDYDYEKDKIIIDLTPENNKITKLLLDYIVSQNPLKNIILDFLDKGYIMHISENKKKVTFDYSIFPSLLSEKIFILNIDLYTTPVSLCHKINLINDVIINKSHLKFIQNIKHLKNSAGQNDLYICYLIIWSMVLWYTDEKERDFRFLEMLEILEKLEEHDMKTFELLFKVLADYSTDENIILLYRKFIHYRLNPSWEIFSIVSKIIKKKQNAKNKNKLLQEGITVNEIRAKFINENIDINKNNFRERVFRINNRDTIFSNNILYHAYNRCNECKSILNLKKLCSDLSLLKTEKDNMGNERIRCRGKIGDKRCTNLIEPKLRFRFGEELYNQKLYMYSTNKFSTSVFRNINFMSPTEIKRKLLEITLAKKKTVNLDVEMFRFNYPDIFWNIVFYFELYKIDKSFFLPYDKYKRANYRNTEIQNHVKCIDKNKNILPYNINSEMLIINNENEEKNNTSKDNSKNASKENSGIMPIVKENLENVIFNDASGNKDIKEIDLRNNKNKLFIFSKNNIRKKYGKDDICLQKVYEFAFLTKIGMINFKNSFSYEKNIAYNEMPLIYYEKDNNSSSSTSLNIKGSSEGTVAQFLFRDSVLFPAVKRNSALSNNILLPIQKNFNSSGVSIGASSSNNSCLSLNKVSNGEIALNSYLMFEESDDSSYDDDDSLE